MKADYIIRSNVVFDPKRKKCFSGGVAVCGERIGAVFEKGDDISGLCGAETKILSYDDQLLMPSFIDSHTHMFYGALSIRAADLVKPMTEEDTAKELYRFAKDSTDDWIFGFGWNQHYWSQVKLPNRKTLDQYFPDRPVVAIHEEMHALWVNTKALELSGFFSGEIPARISSKVLRDKNGLPSGYLLEEEEMSLIFDSAFKNNDGSEKTLLKNYIKEMNRVGIGSASNIQCHGILNSGACSALDVSGELNVRIGLVPSAHLPFDEILKMREMYDSPCLWFSGVKGFVDGTPMGYTGYLVEDYADKPGFRGEAYLTVKNFLERAEALDREGVRIRLHACGDGAVREALDIYEEIQKKNGRRDSRHTIEHIEVYHPNDLDRFSELGTVASIQPEHLSCRIFKDHPFHRLLGEKRSQFAYPVASFLERNVGMAFGSDNPIVELNPMRGIYRAVTRRARDKMPHDGWNPQERIPIADALRAYTYGSAYQMFRENDLGSLSPGYYADLIVADRDLFKIDPEEILDTQILLNMSGGSIVYEK